MRYSCREPLSDPSFDASHDEPLARQTVERTPIGICHVAEQGPILYANPAAARMLGFAAPEALIRARDAASLFHEQSGAETIAALSAGSSEFPPTDAILRRSDDSALLAQIEGNVVRDDPRVWSLFIRETASERDREIELARALAELENTIQTIPDILYTLDVEARLVRWNRKLETATGWSPQDLQGKPGFELFPEEEKRTFAKAIMDAFATGYAEFETQLLSRDGRTMAYQWTAVPLEANGAVVGLAGAGRDITERRRNEQARAELEEVIRRRAREWQLTFDAIESPILIADRTGRIVRLNRSARDLIGDVAFGDIVGRNLEDFSEMEPWNTFLGLARSGSEIAGAEANDPFSGRTWHVARSTISHELAVAQGLSPSSEERSILIARDVTRMLELQEIARKNQVMSAVGQLIVGVAHEVRNPIFGISATLDAFEATFAVDADSRQFIEVLRGEIGRLSELMQELLDYGKPSRMELHEGSLAEVVANATRACERIGERSHVAIESRVPPDVPPVRMDRKKLMQVFQNLIENAIQFSPPESKVTITSEVVEQGGSRWVAASVEDSGSGFHENDLDRIFEPFFTRRRGGTGLGLSIVQRIVEEHGGRITAANRTAGGAKMTVLLPRG